MNNSLLVSRAMMPDLDRDLKLLIQEYASLLAHQRNISREHIKEHIPALFHSVVVQHPLYQKARKQYAATNPEWVAQDRLASSVQDEQTQNLIIALGQILVEAEVEYLASVNVVQQVASEVLSANIRAVRKAGRVIKDHGSSDAIQSALKQHDTYLELLGNTEKLIQGCVDALTKEKNGDERYVESCNILVNALKKSMKQNREVKAQVRKAEPNEAQTSFLEKLQSKLNKSNLKRAFIISFLPDVYEAINPGISDAQMEALVGLAEHYLCLRDAYLRTEEAFKTLQPLERQSLVQGGVKLLSPYDYVMAVVYDPMQIAAKYFSDQFDAYLQPLYMAKNAVNTVADVAYSATTLMATPFTYARDFFFSPDKTYTETLITPLFSKTHPLNEMAYLKGMAFYVFLRGLNKSDQLVYENKAALFGHYFHHNPANGETELSLDQYLANEEYFAQVFSFFEESGSPKLRTRKDFKNQEEKANRYLLAVIVRVNQLQAALSQTKSAEEVEVVIKELNDFRQHFNSKSEKLDLPESIEHVRPKPFATQYLTAKLRLIVPLINDRLLVPVIYRLVDEGIVTKENSAYHRLAEILKILRKKQLVTASDVSFLLSLFPESESNQRSKLRALILQVMPWMLGGDIVSAVGDEEKKEQPHHLVASIRTEAREMQDMVQNTLTLLQPKLILSAIITHLDHHIQKIERLKSFSEELNDVYEAKLIYCNTIKELLLGVLGRGSLSDHKKLAKALMEMSVGLPAIPAYGKGDMAKLFFRVANEFGPVSGGGDGVPLVEKILNFILNEMDSEVLTTAYDNLKRAYASRNKVIEGNDHDDLSLVWFEEESADPFDMSVQGGRVARVVILKYMDALIGEVYSRSGLDGVLVFFKGIPGYAFISNQLSHYIGKALTKEKVIELICSILGVQVHPELHEQDYMTRLSHAFFKVKAMQGGSAGLKEKIELTGLAAQPEELEKMSAEVDRLMQLTGDFSFNPLADPRALAEIAFQNAGEFREHQIQLLLVHCEYLVKYAKRLSDEAKRSTILLNVTNAMEFCSAQDGLHDFLTTKQAGMVLHLLEEGKAGSRDAAEQAKNSLIDTINTVKGQLKKEHDGVIRRATRKLTPLNIVGLVGYYLGDLGSLAYTIYSLITPVLAFVSAVKAMSTVTFQALSLAAGGALITSPVGLAILALRFVGGLAWHAYHCRQDFRKDWRASQSALGKAGVIAKYSLIVLGKALVSTFLSAALVDTAVGLIKKVRGLDIPFVNFIKDKLNVRAKLRELQNIKTTMQVLRGCVMDNEAFDQAVVEARKLITGLKYHADKANEWNKQIDQAVQHRDAFRGFSAASSTDELVAKRLKANPATKPTVPLPAWDGFVEAGLAGEGVTHFAFDVNLPDSPSGRSRVSVLNGSVFNGGSGGSVVTGLDPSREAQDVSSVVLSSSP